MSDKKQKQKKPQKLKARLARGFPDRSPGDIRATDEMMARIKLVYERFGFEPVETPLSNTPMRWASSCPIPTAPTRACSRSRTMTSSGCRCAMT
jgi:hypothetical protein